MSHIGPNLHVEAAAMVQERLTSTDTFRLHCKAFCCEHMARTSRAIATRMRNQYISSMDLQKIHPNPAHSSQFAAQTADPMFLHKHFSHTYIRTHFRHGINAMSWDGQIDETTQIWRFFIKSFSNLISLQRI